MNIPLFNQTFSELGLYEAVQALVEDEEVRAQQLREAEEEHKNRRAMEHIKKCDRAIAKAFSSELLAQLKCVKVYVDSSNPSVNYHLKFDDVSFIMCLSETRITVDSVLQATMADAYVAVIEKCVAIQQVQLASNTVRKVRYGS
jgi:hypothetical protein